MTETTQNQTVSQNTGLYECFIVMKDISQNNKFSLIFITICTFRRWFSNSEKNSMGLGM